MAASPHDDLLKAYEMYLHERNYQAVKVPETTTRTPDLEYRDTEHLLERVQVA